AEGLDKGPTAGLDDTIYKHKDNVVNGWGNFYLLYEASMQVLGVVEGTSCPCDQLVLMTCEDRKIYAYDGEELHVVASDLKQLCDKGIMYPASKSYYKGERFQTIFLDPPSSDVSLRNSIFLGWLTVVWHLRCIYHHYLKISIIAPPQMSVNLPHLIHSAP
uniref:Uncharacterized protein n=1 Tax=Sparus aurata TaxID=8175 RepID=A0A671UK01_SPAAU